MPSLLNYLVQPNPDLDRTYRIQGSNTINARYKPIEGTRPWLEFSYETVMSCLGDILNQAYAPGALHAPAPIQPHLRTIIDETSLNGCLSMFNLIILNRALQLVETSLAQRGFRSIRWGWASLSRVFEDNRFRPDWAGFHQVNSPPYQDLLPGDTKLRSKFLYAFKDSAEDAERNAFEDVMSQVVSYSAVKNSRYGYVITDEELVCFRRTRTPDPTHPLSTSRQPRAQAQQRQRLPSISTVYSDTSDMVMDTTAGSSNAYIDNGNPDVNEEPLETVMVPWNNHGPGALTLNLALFFLHLLAAKDNSLQESYQSLNDEWHSREYSE